MPNQHRTPEAFCPCGKPMRGYSSRCSICMGRIKSAIARVRQRALAPINADINARQLPAKERAQFLARTAQLLSKLTETIEDSARIRAERREVFAQYPEYAEVINNADAQLVSTEESLRANFAISAQQNHEALHNFHLSLAVPLNQPANPPAEPAANRVAQPAPAVNQPAIVQPVQANGPPQFTSETAMHEKCSLPLCESLCDWILPCRSHLLCVPCMEGIFLANDPRCPLCRVPVRWGLDTTMVIRQRAIAPPPAAAAPAAAPANVLPPAHLQVASMELD